VEHTGHTEEEKEEEDFEKLKVEDLSEEP